MRLLFESSERHHDIYTRVHKHARHHHQNNRQIRFYDAGSTSLTWCADEMLLHLGDTPPLLSRHISFFLSPFNELARKKKWSLIERDYTWKRAWRVCICALGFSRSRANRATTTTLSNVEGNEKKKPHLPGSSDAGTSPPGW